MIMKCFLIANFLYLFVGLLSPKTQCTHFDSVSHFIPILLDFLLKFVFDSLFPSHLLLKNVQFNSVQSLSCVWFFVTPWTAAHQASLSIAYSQSLLKLMPIELVMPSSHLILCRPLVFLPSIFPSIRVFSKPPCLPAFNLSQHQSLFKLVSSLHQVAKVLESQLQHQSFKWIIRTDFL